MEDFYSYKKDFIDPPLDEYICSHCEDVLTQPMLVGCCGSHFCERCLRADGQSGYVCPDKECESKGCEITAILDKKKWKKILSLEVACPFSSQGCLWTGELGKQTGHIDQMGDCKYATLQCMLGCGKSLDKNEMDEHLKHQCLRRLVTCTYCTTQGEYRFISGEDHMTQCIMDCTCNCGTSKFKQSHLEEHLRKCPLHVVECDYYYAGCTRQGQRKEMVVHVEKNIHTHLSLVTQFFLTELETKDKLLTNQNIMLCNTLEELTEMYSKELAEKNRRIEELESKMQEEIQRTLKQKEVDFVNKLKIVTEEFESRYNELKHNLNSLDIKLPESIDTRKIELQYLIHKGKHNSEIWKGKNGENGMVVAVKKTDTLLEALVLKKLSHTNVIRMLAVVTEAENATIVLEYMPCGNLKEYVKNNTLLLHQQISLCRQIAKGLDYIHQKFCMHRQVRIDNVLVSGGLHCKINDFSLAAFVSKYDDHLEAKDITGREKWSAPEVLKEKKYYLKSDVWAFGILIWQLIMSGKEPYPGLTAVEAGKNIVAGIDMKQPKDCSNNFYVLMENCWRVDPWVRPTFEALSDLLDHVKDSHKYTDANDPFTSSLNPSYATT